MEQISVSIPYAFIASRVLLTWTEAKHGVEEGLFPPSDAIELATDLLSHGSDSEDVLALASCGRDEPVLELITKLSEVEPTQDAAQVQRLWTFLILSWIYEHRDQFEDPLDLAEKVYDDSGHPEDVAPFVRYMPSDEPDLGSREQNDERLRRKWNAYLVREGNHFQARATRPG